MNELLSNPLFSMLFAFILSLLIAGVYYKVHEDTLVEEMMLTLLLLPVVICTIIYTIGSNVAGAFSLAGIFTIVRFRSTQASPKDITYILIGVAAGLTAAMNFYIEGLILIVFSIVIIVLFEKFNKKKTTQTLKVLIPEDLVNDEAVEQILQKYTTYFGLEEVRTKDLGSLFELVYKINIQKSINYKEMIDELRIINGNLTIKLTK
ncbi:MAG: DUF4956 domain-containing protein [Mycoplasmatales bacterium]